MNYNQEVEKLNQGSETWKPGVGVHEFVVLAEPEETEYVEEGKTPTPQIKLLIEIKGKQLNWFVGKGKTMKSAYGQLMVIGKYHKGLNGQKLELIVQEAKDKNGEVKNSYMFPLAAKIVQAEKENPPQPPPAATEEKIEQPSAA